MGSVLFVVMPFGALEAPQVGVSTMKAQLRRHGLACDIAYLNFPFAAALGPDNYQEIINYAGTLFLGEWLFAQNLFPASLDHQGYIDNILIKGGGFDAAKVQRLLDWTHLIEPFLNFCLAEVAWERYEIIGFTTMFEQNLASLALAKRLKERYPDKILVIGGANCAGPMGRQLHQAFPFLDFVFTGEADLVFPELARRLLAGEPWQNGLTGFVYRQGQQSVDTGPAPLLRDLDALPYPQYEDFVHHLHFTPVTPWHKVQMVLETSRGCWWGEKNHCRFCGLHDHELPYRTKTPPRALAEILHLASRYGFTNIMPVDNILNLAFFKTLLPELRRRQPGLSLFYETKANLKKEQVQLLREAGVTRIQPGIESFSANVLKLMHKGVKPWQNIQLLKWCRQYQVDAAWNLLYGFPGENSQDYRDTLEIVQAISHLHPPMAYGWIGLHRFSPMFHEPERFQLRHIRPLAAYEYLYPFPAAVRENLAYFFDFDFDGKEKAESWFQPVKAAVEIWQAQSEEIRLEVCHRDSQGMTVLDTRPHRLADYHYFHPWEAAILAYCDEPKTEAQIQSFLASQWLPGAHPAAWLPSFLEEQRAKRLLWHFDQKYLNLILLEPPAASAGGAFWTR
ncbi:MAG: RiPP maturation radical SAM C-methyltransferase [Desulfobacca sp.]|uniref:RiPP maturation radical SAM C-methyltransferase n=1 Tax=Desulfobacca sp. TaxID=2067990 RepID=UPI00404A5ECE